MKKLLFLVLVASLVFLSGCNAVSNKEFEEFQAELDAIEDFDDTILLAEIALLETEIDSLESDLASSDDGTQLIASITSLEIEIAILEGYLELIGATLSNVPGGLDIAQGESLDLLALGVTAIDAIDGVVTNDITVNISDTSVLPIGDYEVTYAITDSDGNSTSESFMLNVWYRDGEYDFEVTNDGAGIIITNYKGYADDDLDIVIPNTFGGLPVLVIDSYAFVEMEISSVVIPDTVTDIGDYAFAFEGT